METRLLVGVHGTWSDGLLHVIYVRAFKYRKPAVFFPARMRVCPARYTQYVTGNKACMQRKGSSFMYYVC